VQALSCHCCDAPASLLYGTRCRQPHRSVRQTMQAMKWTGSTPTLVAKVDLGFACSRVHDRRLDKVLSTSRPIQSSAKGKHSSSYTLGCSTVGLCFHDACLHNGQAAQLTRSAWPLRRAICPDRTPSKHTILTHHI